MKKIDHSMLNIILSRYTLLYVIFAEQSRKLCTYLLVCSILAKDEFV